MGILNPLTDKHCEQLDCVLNNEQNIKDTIAACEECGLDMSQQREKLQAQIDIAAAIKRKFNPLST